MIHVSTHYSNTPLIRNSSMSPFTLTLSPAGRGDLLLERRVASSFTFSPFLGEGCSFTSSPLWGEDWGEGNWFSSFLYFSESPQTLHQYLLIYRDHWIVLIPHQVHSTLVFLLHHASFPSLRNGVLHQLQCRFCIEDNRSPLCICLREIAF